ncbi:hypothetical protein HDV00_008472 [Rhizophlyctis rosea]|nr:hypothetical protein HDV00_008472 [Rhizophlyctis rosea]
MVSRSTVGSPAPEGKSSYTDSNLDSRGEIRHRRRDHQPEWMSFDSKPKDTAPAPTSSAPADNYDDDIQRFKARMRAQEKAAANKSDTNGNLADVPSEQIVPIPTISAGKQSESEGQIGEGSSIASTPGISPMPMKPDVDTPMQEKPPIDQLFGPGGLSSDTVDFSKFFFDDLDVNSPASMGPARPTRKTSESSRAQSRFFRIFEEQSSLHQQKQPLSPAVSDNDDPIARFLATGGGGDRGKRNFHGGTSSGAPSTGVSTTLDRDPLQQFIQSGAISKNQPHNGRDDTLAPPPPRMPSEEEIIRSMGVDVKTAIPSRMMSEEEVLQALGANRRSAGVPKLQGNGVQEEKMAFGRVLSMLARAIPTTPRISSISVRYAPIPTNELSSTATVNVRSSVNFRIRPGRVIPIGGIGAE